MINYEQLFNTIKGGVLSVGEFIRTEQRKFDRDRVEYKGINDMVSYVDKASEEQLVKILESALPEAGFLTEEATINKKGDLYTWIIDPLDGTTNFIHGIPAYAISIALQEEEELTLGIVYEVNRDELFYAWKGGKAYLNGNEIKVSSNTTLEKSLLATGFPFYNFSKMKEYLQIFSVFAEKTHGLRRLGAAALDLAYVACGRFDGYFEYNLQPWDLAGGAVILRQAGGSITNFKGGKDLFNTREVVASNGHIAQEMLQVIQKYLD